MENIKDLWSHQIVPVCKNMFDITCAMVPGMTKDSGTTKKAPVAAEACTCPKNQVSTGTSARAMSFLTPTGQNMIRIAGISGALAVSLGAYGAHVIMINKDIPEEQKNSFRTANLYHFVGTFGLVAASLGRYPMMTGMMMATGTMLFCGSCYYHGLTGEPSVKKIAPIGGTTLILAWLSLIL